MQIDMMIVPDVFDRVHAGLAGMSLLLLLLSSVLLVLSISASRRAAKAEASLVLAMTASKNPPPTKPVAPPVTQAPPVHAAEPESALQLLGLLQQEARFVDFVQEDIAGHSDADIGAAARIIHEGSRKVIRQYFELRPVCAETEGVRLSLPKGFDAAAIRVTGNIVGEPPFSGTLIHRGWKANASLLPKVAEGHDLSVIAPAEVEL